MAALVTRDLFVLFQIAGPVMFASLIAFYALATLLWKVERQDCACAQDWREKTLLFTVFVNVVAAVAGGVAGFRAALQ